MKCSVVILLLAVAGLAAGADVNADINGLHKRHKKHKHRSLRVVPDEVGNGLGLKDLKNGLHQIVLGEAKPMELDNKLKASTDLESVEKDLKTAHMEEKKMAVLAKNLASERILLEQTRASADAFDTDGENVKVVQAQTESVAAMLKKTSDLLDHSKVSALEASKRALRRATEVNQAAVASQHAAEARQAEASAAEKQYFNLQREASAEKKNVADIGVPNLESTLKKPEIVAAPATASQPLQTTQNQNTKESAEEEEEEVYED